MTAALEAVRDKPVGYWQMDNTSPFTDYSGYNVSGVMNSGTAGTAIALMAGASYATTFSNANVGRFPSTVFVRNSEEKPFSLEAWVYVQDKGADSEIKILSNATVYDGLTVNGTKFSFSTAYTSTGSAKVSYDIQVNRRVHVVGVHTSDKNMLYIDGELVGEVEISEAQKADTYADAGGNLYCGTTTSADTIAINGVGLYANSLSASAIARHFAVGSQHVPRESIPSIFGGVRIPLTQNEADVFLEQTWTTEFDWESASLTNVVVEDDRIKPRLEAGVSLAGTWLDVFPLSVTDATSIHGVNMLWDGEGAIIEASLDGTTWETVERGKNLSIIPPGFNPQGKELEIRVSFSGGVSDDPAYVDNLTVTGFKTGTAPIIPNRTIILPGFIRNDYEPVEQRDDWGTDLNGGTLTISADTSPDAVAPKTVEIWMKRQTAAAGSFSTNLSTATNFYSNGVSGSGYPQGEWVVRHFVNAAGITGDITLGGNIQVGQVVLYNDAKTATEVKDIYDSYIGLNIAKAPDTSVVAVTEPAQAATIYANDWSIVAAG